MKRNLFNAQISVLPCSRADDCEIETTTLGLALVTDAWRAKVEGVRSETDPVKKALLKSGLPAKPTADQLAAVKAENDPARKAQMKVGLPCFTPSGTFSHVSEKTLIAHSGFISIDIDYKPGAVNPALPGIDLKASAANIPHVAYCGHSCGGTGYVLMIPIADPAKHRAYFRALAYHFERNGLTVDRACRNVSRLRFASYDPAPYVNTAAKVWDIVLPEQMQATTPGQKPEPPSAEVLAEFEANLKQIERLKIDITDSGDYDRMREIATALINAYGSDGLPYAQRLFSFMPGYDPGITETNYHELERYTYAETLATVNYYARQEIGKHDFDNLSL